MKTIDKLSHAIKTAYYFPQGVIFTLALTSLLCGIGFTANNNATAAPHVGNIQLSQNVQNNQNRLPRKVARIILNDAAKRSGAPIANLKITQITAKSFSNPCLFQFGEVCTREYRPIKGWEVIVQVKGQSWTYHVNRTGSQLILDPKINGSPNVTLPKAIASKILTDASQRSGVALANLKITQATTKNFGNPCEFNFGEICTKEYNPVPGWEVIVQVKDQSWKYHVNRTGSQLILDPKINASSPNVTLPSAIANKILNDAAQRSGVAVANLTITQATAKIFGNECHFNFGEVCAEIYNPVEGWEVIIKVKDQSWTYHVNQSGSAIVLDPKISTKS
jgi:hypothetical protein